MRSLAPSWRKAGTGLSSCRAAHCGLTAKHTSKHNTSSMLVSRVSTAADDGGFVVLAAEHCPTPRLYSLKLCNSGCPADSSTSAIECQACSEQSRTCVARVHRYLFAEGEAGHIHSEIVETGSGVHTRQLLGQDA